MSKLFDKARPTILEHIKHAYLKGELQKNSTCRKFRQVQKEGKRTVIRGIEHFNLDVIISVGYRVKSKRGTQFRIWANKILKDYLVKCYVLKERKLKEQTGRIKELEKTLDIFSKVTESYQLKKDELEAQNFLDYLLLKQFYLTQFN